MSERRPVPSMRPDVAPQSVDEPSPELVDFIRFCHDRRHVGWPDLYDEMCAVAARRAFRGWDHEDLAARGVTFALGEMPRLAGWVRATLAVDPAGERVSAEPSARAGERATVVIGPVPQPSGS